ncbi:prolipoprotein diacylglyceryl transferase [Paenibacillus alkalitolerans]|uniref:hypothetical protein n=1 Tax=Paenibacillus alkalitolerans TaxID=2799335 RepID=UPI0018F4D2CF|nr:hypothetical protein [Paenibacillus alkalitolerans]
MKKFHTFLFIALMTVSVIACSSNQPSQEADDGASEVTDTETAAPEAGESNPQSTDSDTAAEPDETGGNDTQTADNNAATDDNGAEEPAETGDNDSQTAENDTSTKPAETDDNKDTQTPDKETSTKPAETDDNKDTQTPDKETSTKPTETEDKNKQTPPDNDTSTTKPAETEDKNTQMPPDNDASTKPAETEDTNTQTPPDNDTSTKPAETAAKQVSPKGKKMAIVGRTGGKAQEDAAIAKRMMVLGLKVTLVDEKQISVEKLKQYDIVYFSPTLNEKFVKDGQMKGLDVPQIYGKRQGMAGIRLAPPPDPNADPDDEESTSEKIRSIAFKDSKHPVAAGFSGEVEVFRKVDEDKEKIKQLGVSGQKTGKNAKVIATVAGQPKDAYIYAYEKGSKADDGTEVPARIAYAFGSIGLQQQLTEDGWKVLSNIVIWALQTPENP